MRSAIVILFIVFVNKISAQDQLMIVSEPEYIIVNKDYKNYIHQFISTNEECVYNPGIVLTSYSYISQRTFDSTIVLATVHINDVRNGEKIIGVVRLDSTVLFVDESILNYGLVKQRGIDFRRSYSTSDIYADYLIEKGDTILLIGLDRPYSVGMNLIYKKDGIELEIMGNCEYEENLESLKELIKHDGFELPDPYKKMREYLLGE